MMNTAEINGSMMNTAISPASASSTSRGGRAGRLAMLAARSGLEAKGEQLRRGEQVCEMGSSLCNAAVFGGLG